MRDEPIEGARERADFAAPNEGACASSPRLVDSASGISIALEVGVWKDYVPSVSFVRKQTLSPQAAAM